MGGDGECMEGQGSFNVWTNCFWAHKGGSNNRIPTASAVARILATAEAVGIRLFDPPLCAQKQFVQTLSYKCCNWPGDEALKTS